jgi:multimeric flavodoxin WrbA
MSIEVLGISGSPIENSNTDRLIQAVLDATELKCEFVKLSQINIRPCLFFNDFFEAESIQDCT